jgi:hypothetical protein
MTRFLPMLLTVCLACSSPALASGLLMEEEALTEHEMEQLRGGGIMAGGMVIDFALFQQTLINGELRTELQLSSNEMMNSLQPGDMQTLIQIGNGNAPLSAIQDIPGLVTIISNSVDNSVIQNMSNLNLDISNIAAARQSAIAPMLEFQMIGSMR